MKKIASVLALGLLMSAAPAFATKLVPTTGPDPNNVPAPLGPILDLAGQTINFGTYTQYSVTFIAGATTEDVTFAFRNDPGYSAVDNVSVTAMGSSTNLISNGSFASGLSGWNYDNVYGATFGGVVSSGCQGLPNDTGDTANWCDGATQAYDAIDQTISTVVGQTYTITFDQDVVDATGFAGSHYQQLSTNGCVDTSGISCANGTQGNGIDTLVYVGATIPPPANTPEPSTLVLSALGAGLLGLALKRS